MKIVDNSYKNRSVQFGAFSKEGMAAWRAINGLPEYMNAAYTGFTGGKYYRFPSQEILIRKSYSLIPDVTNDVKIFEEETFQELLNIMRKPFGKIRALWKMLRNCGTGERWDTKFLPEFPGRDANGSVQFARYNNEVVSANDLSNIVFGHTCKMVNIPEWLALLAARLDASGILEPFSKGRMPSLELISFRDSKSDQLAIRRGMREFELSNYRLN